MYRLSIFVYTILESIHMYYNSCVISHHVHRVKYSVLAVGVPLYSSLTLKFYITLVQRHQQLDGQHA